MSIEAKTVFLSRMEQQLRASLTAADLSAVLSALSDQLPAFEVEQRTADAQPDDLLDAYLSAKGIEGRSPKTLTRYGYLIRRLMTSARVSTRELTVYHLRRFLADEKGRGLSDRTLEATRQVLSAYFGWLHREGLIRSNPAANLGTIKCAKKVPEILTDVELELLRSACKDIRERALIAFLTATGCRVGELVNLDRDALDLQRRYAVVHGKGNKERLVYFDPVTAMILGSYLQTRTDTEPALFISHLGARIRAGGVGHILRELGQRAGVDHVHPHRFRRTCATRLISRGMAIQDVARILGHDKIETTMRYIQLDDRKIHSTYNSCA